MEIVLGAIADWLQKHLNHRPLVKWPLITMVFALGLWLAWMDWAG